MVNDLKNRNLNQQLVDERINQKRKNLEYSIEQQEKRENKFTKQNGIQIIISLKLKEKQSHQQQ
ncbi:unnamed protein product [Paramecium octaurelia]|uniref:Uncharacterized protein n=1 Tax=Paramecium octaurelia TaxID=43137 RepID=A0A8S1SZ97_PAROT|nr:unnamed protein product [Paramecium octaurelia]